MDVESVYLCTKLKGKTHFILDYSQGCVYIVLGEDFYVLKEQERICERKDSKSGCLTDKKSLDHKVEMKVDGGVVWRGQLDRPILAPREMYRAEATHFK
jgi:hypothetical protein